MILNKTLTPLIRGSLAIDTILLHKGAFESRILPHEISRLNVSFGIDQSREEYGGTAGNIAYGCQLLGDKPLVNACVGELDQGSWTQRIGSWGLPREALRIIEGKSCPRAYIITDADNNQITAFQPGALAHIAPLPADGFDFAILAPDGAGSMAHAVHELRSRKIPYLLDPGQALPSLLEGQAGADFKNMLLNASGLFVNDYEAELCAKAMGTPFESVAQSLPFCVRTLGSKGCEIWIREGSRHATIGVCKPERIEDPTGCGDAFRSGFLHGLSRGWDLEDSARLGSVMGSFAIEQIGGQNHAPDIDQIHSRYEESFGPMPSTIHARPSLGVAQSF